MNKNMNEKPIALQSIVWIKIICDKEEVKRDADKKGSEGSRSLLSHSIAALPNKNTDADYIRNNLRSTQTPLATEGCTVCCSNHYQKVFNYSSHKIRTY